MKSLSSMDFDQWEQLPGTGHARTPGRASHQRESNIIRLIMIIICISIIRIKEAAPSEAGLSTWQCRNMADNNNNDNYNNDNTGKIAEAIRIMTLIPPI